MWPSRPIPGNPLQTDLDDRRSGAHCPPLLLMLPMSRRSVSGGCRTGHRKYGVFSRSTPQACCGGPGGSVRSRSRADAAPGRFGGDHQIRGAYRRGHRRRYRPARARRDPESPAVRSTRPGRPADSHPVCANGRDRSSRSEERDGGPARQDRGPTRSYTGGQVGMWVHANHLGRERLRHPRSGFHHLHWGHRNGRTVWQAHLSGSAKTRLEPRQEEGGHRGWSRMDLDSGRRTLPGRDSDCSTSTMLASICGRWRASCIPTRKPNRKLG